MDDLRETRKLDVSDEARESAIEKLDKLEVQMLELKKENKYLRLALYIPFNSVCAFVGQRV